MRKKEGGLALLALGSSGIDTDRLDFLELLASIQEKQLIAHIQEVFLTNEKQP